MTKYRKKEKKEKKSNRFHIDHLGHAALEVYIVLIHPEAVPDADHMAGSALDFGAEAAAAAHSYLNPVHKDLEVAGARIVDSQGRVSQR